MTIREFLDKAKAIAKDLGDTTSIQVQASLWSRSFKEEKEKIIYNVYSEKVGHHEHESPDVALYLFEKAQHSKVGGEPQPDMQIAETPF